MLAAALVTSLALACPLGGDLLALPTPPPAPAPAPPDLLLQLASRRAAALPSSLLGPIDLGERGAVAAAIRCTGTPERPSAACDLVVAHLAPVGGRLELSGVVQALPVRGKGGAPARDVYAVTGLALRDLAGDAAPELVVRWRVGPDEYVAALTWLGFGKLFGPERVRDATCAGRLEAACTTAGATELVHRCGPVAAPRAVFRYAAARAAFTRARP